MKDDGGFTLTELLVATAVMALVFGLLSAIVVQFYQVSRQGANRLAVLRDSAQAAEYLGRDVNSASVAAVVDDTHLILTIPDALGGAARTVRYTVAPPILVRNDASGDVPVARHVIGGTSFGPRGTFTGTLPVTVILVSRAGAEEQRTTLRLALRAWP